MEKTKILITGGAGYLGSIITRHLLEQGNKVTCLDNLMYHQRTPLMFIDNPNYDFVFGDCRNKSLLSDLVPKHDVILPLAAIVGMPACNMRPQEAIAINFEAIKNLDEIRGREQILIYPNTNSGYGTTTGETYCDENSPLNPISLYGKLKVNAEKLLLESENAISLRLATVFGISPRMRLDLLVNDFVWQAMTSGAVLIYEKNFKRNYIHIKDVARAFEHSINNFSIMKNNAFNLGLDNANLSKAELAAKIKEYLPRFTIVEGEGKDPDKRNYIVSNQKIRKTGFSTKFSLDDGIQELIKGYQVLLPNNPYKNI
ncbi:MAG: NAD(P)-dependent oxidoreductase [Candidatus Pacearchaeota archaeon]